MALGVTLDFQGYIPKGPSIRIGKITGDGAYPTGGYPITPATFGFQSTILAFLPAAGGGGGFLPSWDHVNSKIKFWEVGAAGAFDEADAADITSSVVCPFIAYGT